MNFYKKQKRIIWYLILGLFWIIYSLIFFITDKHPNAIYYIFLVIGFLYLIGYLNETMNGYVTIKDGKISVNDMFVKKSIPFNQITEIHPFAGDYIIKSKSKEISINTQLLKPDSLKELDQELKKLNVTWT